MKIYIKDLLLEHISVQKIESLPCFITKFKEIYTEEGLFRIKGNKISQLDFIDKTIKTKNLKNNITILIDESYFIVNEKCNRIPYKHYILEVLKKEYKLYPNSNLGLIVIYHDNDLYDLYFETKENVLNNNHENDILTFLSLLNNLK